jgi:hypothetical protein
LTYNDGTLETYNLASKWIDLSYNFAIGYAVENKFSKKNKMLENRQLGTGI